ncbi:MAG: hypothetical protein LBR20_07235 [Propionibacteriaceae bacterium]|jgi:2-succinyl-5-enolpyruvyl-6-hydroxy-3-cyclohexene-1-carboxylate synthase|nr:hypothetical protein [Propionibacteriaceae bacterium]
MTNAVVIAGDARPAVGRQANEFARAHGLPLVAEPSSNARYGDALRYGRVLLASRLAAEIEVVFVFGHPTLSRPVARLLDRRDIQIIRLADEVQVAPIAVTALATDTAWLDKWHTADDSVTPLEPSGALSSTVGPEGKSPGTFWPSFSAEGWRRAGGTWSEPSTSERSEHHPLFLGNSNVIRDFDLAPVPAEAVRVYANRGLSGIDGVVSTAIGVALGLGEPTLAVIGDVSFIHDLNALAIPTGEPRPQLRIVVVDDHGGSIFASLEYGRSEFAAHFERLFATPTDVDLAATVAALGIPVQTVASWEACQQLPEIAGLEVVILTADRSQRQAEAQALARIAQEL